MNQQYESNAKIFKAFCDPNRLMVLDILTKGEHCACKLLEILNVSQSTLSHHMKILTDASVVEVRKEGKWAYYSLSKSGLLVVERYIQELYQ